MYLIIMDGDHERTKLVTNVANQYAPYFKVDTSNEKKNLNHELDAIESKINEYHSALNETMTINREIKEKVPTIYSFYQSMLQTFEYVDSLEEMISEIKSDLSSLEDAVSQAEKDVGMNPNVPILLKPLLFMKEPPSNISQNEMKTFTAPKLKFDPNKYFDDENSENSF